MKYVEAGWSAARPAAASTTTRRRRRARRGKARYQVGSKGASHPLRVWESPSYCARSPAALRVAATASRAALAIKPLSLAIVQSWKPICIIRAA